MVLPYAAHYLTFNRREDAPVFIIAFVLEACSKRNTSGSDFSAVVSAHGLIVYLAKLPWTVHVAADTLVINGIQSLTMCQRLHASYA